MGLSYSSVKTGKFLPGGSQEPKTCTFLGPKVKNAICDGTHPTCRSNLIYMSAGKCRGPKFSNRIELSWFIQVLLYFYWFGTPVALGEGAGRCGVSGCIGVPPTHACMCTCAHTHICMYMLEYTCKEIANGHQHAYHGMHAHMCGLPPSNTPTLPHTHPLIPTGGPPKSVKIQ